MNQTDKRPWGVPTPAVVLILALWLPLPGPALTKSINEENNKNRGKFSLEIFGGYGLLNPSDLNRSVDADNRYQNFVYDAYFDYLLSKNSIEGWTKDDTGKRKKIKNVLPFGMRARYRVMNFLAVSIGFQYFQRNSSQNLDFSYNRDVFYGEEYIEELSYEPYGLSVKAYWPTVGIHLFKHFGQKMTGEAYVLGGPLFARCSYNSDWTYKWYIQGPGYTWPTFESEGLLEQKGSGTGIAMEAGGRIGFPFIRSLVFFLDGGYAFQKVSSLSGSGKEINGGKTETWKGTWKTKPETLSTVWGTLDIKTPTNYRTNGEGFEDFELDLSGFRIKLGFSWVF